MNILKSKMYVATSEESLEDADEFPQYERAPRCTSVPARAFIGLLLWVMFGSTLAISAYLIVVLLTDLHFYVACHSSLVIVISWIVLCALLFLDGLIRYAPTVQKTVYKNKQIKKALMTVDQGTSAKLLVRAELINTKGTSVCSRLIDYPLGILLLWWVFVVIYFIGIGEGRWAPIEF